MRCGTILKRICLQAREACKGHRSGGGSHKLIVVEKGCKHVSFFGSLDKLRLASMPPVQRKDQGPTQGEEST
jgi:hypothetical protein